MTTQIKVSGSWMSAEPHVKVSGSWVSAESGWVKVSGSWVNVYRASPLTVSFNLHSDNSHPTGVAWNQRDRRYAVVDSEENRVFIYDESGTRMMSEEFTVPDDAGGIVWNPDDERYVVLIDVQGSGDHIAVYTTSGTRMMSEEFELASGNDNPTGIAYKPQEPGFSGNYYIVDTTDRRVYTYSTSGTRLPGAEFTVHAPLLAALRGIVTPDIGDFAAILDDDDILYIHELRPPHDLIDTQALHDRTPSGITWTGRGYAVVDIRSSPDDIAVLDGYAPGHIYAWILDIDNSQPQGITWTGARYACVDSDDTVYRYDIDGDFDHDDNFRSIDKFDLHADNGAPVGIAWRPDTQSYAVADNSADRVFVYEEDGTRAMDEEFDLHADNASPTGIAWRPDTQRYAVTDISDNRVFIYSETGTRMMGEEFELAFENDAATGIVWNPDAERYLVIDLTDRNIYVYDEDGTRMMDEEFDYTDANARPNGIAYTGTAYAIVDQPRRRAYIYSA